MKIIKLTFEMAIKIITKYNHVHMLQHIFEQFDENNKYTTHIYVLYAYAICQ